MMNINYLTGKTIKEATKDEYGYKIIFEDGSIFETNKGTETDMFTGDSTIKDYETFQEAQ